MAVSAAASITRQRLALSLTTRFCLPHEGMTQMEYLSRGSAFLLDSASTPTTSPAPPRLRDIKVLTCQHVACPWLFPNYFAEKWDWLQFVSEEFVQHSLQLLEFPSDSDAQGNPTDLKTFRPRVLADIPLIQQVWLHPDRDVAMLALGEQDESQLHELLAQWQLHALTLNPANSKPGDLLLFSGHKQIEDDAASSSEASSSSSTGGSEEDDEDESAGQSVGQFPKEVYGRFVGRSARGQAFAWSEEILEEGMCGGAVVNEAGDCVGLVEGIVPPFNAAATSDLSSDATHEEREAVAATARMQKALENHVAFVPSIEIDAFLKNPDQSLLTGMALPM